MDGLQVLGEIKQRFFHFPVMMVTAYADDTGKPAYMADLRAFRPVPPARHLAGVNPFPVHCSGPPKTAQMGKQTRWFAPSHCK
jgi:CheY-like chemotaxis protein